jgi:hypothetical protein
VRSKYESEAKAKSQEGKSEFLKLERSHGTPPKVLGPKALGGNDSIHINGVVVSVGGKPAASN